MWEDDRYWLPQVLDDQTFEGRFLSEEEKILWRDVAFDVEVDDGSSV